ncbi:Retrovirus-related Pol polyprotein from transposon TNT 1-94 [Senna tora]|uniref:Retrovirus-related Pol polyprotein from transposon TNT 1-94 n=1 Tax=Senna tora TaxID=362788 RepID=A0A834SWY9_9FABA|nr:Retrovirus-related Pol polyprotein from transposon TNT 1-94 [Senna tora]
MSRLNLTPKVVFGNMAADDTAGSFVASNATATNDGWIDATPVLITSHKLNGHNAVTTMVFDPTSAHVAQSAQCASSLQVKIVDDTMAKVSTIGSIKISTTLTLMNDLASGKMLGNAKEYNGLYILRSTHIPTFNKIVLSANYPSNILLWHYRACSRATTTSPPLPHSSPAPLSLNPHHPKSRASRAYEWEGGRWVRWRKEGVGDWT